MKNRLLFAFALMFACLSHGRVWAQQKPQYVFHIPEYPGTQLIENGAPALPLELPFANILRIYKTKNNEPLDQDKVRAFFLNSLVKMGWKEGVYTGQKGGGYLGLQNDVHETRPDGTRIQVAGDFQLWVAPKDGMFTILLKQWRNSSLDTQSKQQVADIIKVLEGDEKQGESHYETLQASEVSGWEYWYENEYLVNRMNLSISDKRVKKEADIDPPGIIDVALLSYRDAALAQAEGATLLAENMISRHSKLVVVGKTVVVLEDDSDTEKAKVDSLVQQLQALAK